MNWDQFFYGMAKYVSTKSKDPSTKVGAVIVAAGWQRPYDDWRDIQDGLEACMRPGIDPRRSTFGYNGFPPALKDDDRLNDRRAKYPRIVHAEHNAILFAPFELTGATLYATTFPCAGCALPIVTKGIARVVAPYLDPDSDLGVRCETRTAIDIFREARILVDHVVD